MTQGNIKIREEFWGKFHPREGCYRKYSSRPGSLLGRLEYLPKYLHSKISDSDGKTLVHSSNSKKSELGLEESVYVRGLWMWLSLVHLNPLAMFCCFLCRSSCDQRGPSEPKGKGGWNCRLCLYCHWRPNATYHLEKG